MSDLFTRLQSEGPQLWRQLSLVQRASLIAVALAAVGAMIFMGQWAQQPEYTAAFTRLSESDASAIVAKLKELKVPYQISDNGSTVRVPSDMVYESRLQLASAGLPRGGTVGFELFDQNSFGLTDFAQKLNYQRALEGELSRTLSRISGVEEARVHLALPQKELFIDREKAATASVVLMLKPGSSPDSKQVRGIVTLVSRSVEGLKPENVSVVDGSGLALSGTEDPGGGTTGQTDVRREAQKSYERTLQRDLQAMLEQVLGPRKAVVLVSAAMDWDQYEASTETYSPMGSMAQVRSSREVTERSAMPPGESQGVIPQYPQGTAVPAGTTPQSPLASATPGTGIATGATPQATPQTPVVTARVGENGYERKETTTNFELSKLVEKTVKAPGSVKRLSVSVMLDGQLEEATVSSISKAVTAAAGLDEKRGDTVVVSALPFDRTTTEATKVAQEESSQRSMYMDWAKLALAGLSVLIVLLLARKAVRGLVGTSPRLAPAPAISVKARERQTVASAPARVALPPEPEIPAVQNEVTELAKTQPKLVAGILKTWLDER